MILDNVTMDLVGKALDAALLNHKVVANNVANVNTQDYRALKLDFDRVFGSVRDAVDGGVSDEVIREALQSMDFEQGVVADSVSRVALDQQMVELTKNSLHYQALINARGKLGSLVTAAIKGGKG